MSGLWSVLLLALLPGGGNLLGGVFAELRGSSPRLLNHALHAASGLVLAIVAVELMPRALDGLAPWWIAAGFAGGGLAYLALESLTERLQRGDEGDGRTGMWMIYIAVAVDLVGDGLMIGAGSAVSTSFAIVLAAGQMLADVPEGYAAVANFRDKGVRRRTRLMLAGSFVLYVVGAALGSWLVLRGAAEAWKLAALSFVAGLLTVAAVEDMIEEAHEARKDSRGSVLAFIGGFTLFILVSAGLEMALGTGEGGRVSGAGSGSASSAAPEGGSGF